MSLAEHDSSFKEAGGVERGDWYLTHTPLQPKKEIGLYVASQGILVPKIYSTLHDAVTEVNAGNSKGFVIRSEHPQDYGGVSDLFDSHHITIPSVKAIREKIGGIPASLDIPVSTDNEDFLSNIALKNNVIARVGRIDQEKFEKELNLLANRDLDSYLQLQHLNEEEERAFREQLTYSYWERLEGVNRTVIADTAIPDKYHIFSTIPGSVENKRASEIRYVAVDNGVILNENSHAEDREDIFATLDLYEKVRHLNRFDGNHCPIIETQSVDDAQYFLQYHRGRDFVPAEHVIDRVNAEDEIAATFVRGATPPEGTKATIHYYGNFRYDPEDIPSGELGAMERYVTPGHTNSAARDRSVQIIARDTVDGNTDGNHAAVSQFTKPEVTVGINDTDFRTLTEGLPIFSDTPPTFDIEIVSDGRTAYLKRTDGSKK